MMLEGLRAEVDRGAVDTVLLALTDMQGRLQGKRLTARHFLAEVAEHGAEGCNYLLGVDVDMTPADGYSLFSWERGYGDFVLRPDLDTLRPVPWQEGTVVCLADVAWEDGSDVAVSPRQVLRRQLARLAERGWTGNAGTELEFIVFRDTYEHAWHEGYRNLEPANLYNVDYSLLGTARVEPLIRRIRNSMEAAGMLCEDSKGECNFGQHEINFRYGDALKTADEHAIYKNAVKEIAALEGMSITFMAKYDQREGNSCHIHFSLADEQGPLFHRDRALFESFLAGQLAALRELTLLLAPNVNSYKRFAAATFAPTTVAWAARTSTRPWRSARSSPRACMGSSTASSSRRCSRATPTSRRTSRRSHTRCATRASCSLRARSRAVRSARRWWTTTSTPPTSSCRRSERRSRTGSATGGSSVCDRGRPVP
jgi:glutamine synthetase